MYIVGEEEIEAIAQVIRDGTMFRYGIGEQCTTFERRYGEYLGTDQVALTASGTNALAAAVTALGIGPGDEVLVPTHTYMATALAVLAAGAIPVVVDVDESLTIDPQAVDEAVGPRTRAIIPVHMWGVVCDMDAIMKVARKRNLFVVEDACQCVGGGYEGRKVGTIGHMGAFSFNYYKNMTAGEGGAVVTADAGLAERARCVIDPCHYYWSGRSEDFRPFASNGSRPTEFMGAMLNVQLDRLPGIIDAMRAEKKQVLKGTRHLVELGLGQAPSHSLDHECGAHVLYTFPSRELAARFIELQPGVVAGNTGRHNYVEWDQILDGQGAAHPLMNPYEMEANRPCRREMSKDACPRSLDILNRTVMIPTDPRHTQADVEALIGNIDRAARTTFGSDGGEVKSREALAVDVSKYDAKAS
jgi:dTDP-4-amino-4,6-dideoxygalactose transaminase